jgi:hypothetical protein
MPLVGFLNSASPDTYRFNADSFREGLAKTGFVEGKNVRIEERWARGDYGSLPALAAELVKIGAVAIAATGDVASALMSLSHQLSEPRQRSRRHRLSRSSSLWRLTRSAQVLSRALRDLARTSRAYQASQTTRLASESNSYAKLSPGSGDWR